MSVLCNINESYSPPLNFFTLILFSLLMMQDIVCRVNVDILTVSEDTRHECLPRWCFGCGCDTGGGDCGFGSPRCSKCFWHTVRTPLCFVHWLSQRATIHLWGDPSKFVWRLVGRAMHSKDSWPGKKMQWGNTGAYNLCFLFCFVLSGVYFHWYICWSLREFTLMSLKSQFRGL